MRYGFLSFLILILNLISYPVFSQAESQTVSDSTLLGLPGDNLNLYGVMDLFQKSKTIEEFEKSLNLEATGINNLDLDLDNKVDFIKVTTKQEKEDFTFVLQIAVNEKETQDVAVILVSRDKDKKVTMQIIGDPDLYGKDFIVEPKTSVTPAVTSNPAYTGDEPVVVSVPATTTTVVVESAPIVQYVYSPAYAPYYPPYSYGYYPPYFAAFTVMAVGMYWGHAAHYHSGYGHGYHGNTTVIHNTNNFNNYNNSRNSSNTVNNNKANGNYSRNNASARPSTGASGSARPSTGVSGSARPSTGASGSARPSTGASGSARPSTGASASTRQSTGASASNRSSTGTSSARPSTSSSNRSSSASSRSNYSSSSASRSRSSSYSGGGGGGGGMSRGGGGGGGGGGRRR